MTYLKLIAAFKRFLRRPRRWGKTMRSICTTLRNMTRLKNSQFCMLNFHKRTVSKIQYFHRNLCQKQMQNILDQNMFRLTCFTSKVQKETKMWLNPKWKSNSSQQKLLTAIFEKYSNTRKSFRNKKYIEIKIDQEIIKSWKNY